MLYQYYIAKTKKTFCGFSMGRNQYWAGRVCDLCVYYMTGTPEGSTESGFMEKPGIEPATPEASSTMRALSSARCTDVRLYTVRIKIGTNQRALGELSHY